MKLSTILESLPTRYEILKDVINDSRKKIELKEKPVQVWTLIDENKFKEIGLKHNVSAFIEDKFHDWDWKDGYLQFYAHSGSKGEKHDLIIVYQK